ncbi:hypothetical protein ASPVEDRAFT_31521 [Aspergillus versicolor CBS 583.65]|uniref:Uncharacterized protein n=1 Tax=Aspergillus versicolor CBS 583.65 TaxID=1036611 RepID=A0A1L9PU94_ASPVE|nr:uncharacterized protein ASPVEDRAFT_31521 [Aspergillus versicolor CBS 583.65]OJJ05108.1 hypothetical protein ASPVEDRAFT_31521 [Aspergillus versicolor CBS 583.65]
MFQANRVPGEECISQTEYPDPPETTACGNTIFKPMNVQSQSGNYHNTGSSSSTNGTDAADPAFLGGHPEEIDVAVPLPSVYPVQYLPDGTNIGAQCEKEYQTYPAKLASDRDTLKIRVRELERNGSQMGKRLLLELQKSRNAETRYRDLAKDLFISNRRIHHLEHLVSLQDKYIDHCLVKTNRLQGDIARTVRSATYTRTPSQVRRSARIRDKVSKQRRAKC